MSRHWESQAQNWVRWAREPDFDSYWKHSGPPFFEIVPAPGPATLEVGCGEGRVARDLARRGHRVTGVDASPTLLRHAQEADPDGDYVLADAAHLPFADGSFEVVVAFNSLMDIEDMPGAVREAARALTPGGRFCVCIVHPLADSGRFADDGRFALHESYFEHRRFELRMERRGIEMTFGGWCRPVEDYARAFEDAGLAIELLREPKDPAGGVWARIPNFLILRLRKWPPQT